MSRGGLGRAAPTALGNNLTGSWLYVPRAGVVVPSPTDPDWIYAARAFVVSPTAANLNWRYIPRANVVVSLNDNTDSEP